MAFPGMKQPAQGMSASAAMGQHNHDRAQQGAFAAQKRLNIARQLGAVKGPQAAPAANAAPVGGGDFRQHAAAASGVPGVQAPEVHGAIDALASAGHFTPVQQAALKAHQGPLMGPQGQKTVAKIGGAIRARRAQGANMRPPMQRPMGPPGPPMAPRPPMGPMANGIGAPSQGPVAGGGMPAGMGQ